MGTLLTRGGAARFNGRAMVVFTAANTSSVWGVPMLTNVVFDRLQKCALSWSPEMYHGSH